MDEDPTPDRFVLTGSPHFGLTEAVSQSLAGHGGAVASAAAGARRARALRRAVAASLHGGADGPAHTRVDSRPPTFHPMLVATRLHRHVCRARCPVASQHHRPGRVFNLRANVRWSHGCRNRPVGDWPTPSASATTQSVPGCRFSRRAFWSSDCPLFDGMSRKRQIKAPKLHFLDSGARLSPAPHSVPGRAAPPPGLRSELRELRRLRIALKAATHRASAALDAPSSVRLCTEVDADRRHGIRTWSSPW